MIRRFLPGFIANRLQSALTQEALFLLDNGYATAEQIDEAAKNSFALRTPILGLVKRFDYAGLDLTQKILRNRQYAPPQVIERSPAVERLVEAGTAGSQDRQRVLRLRRPHPGGARAGKGSQAAAHSGSARRVGRDLRRLKNGVSGREPALRVLL